ncbi:MAG: endolytic transglycosylase MltG, partial [Desulfobacterales bacterium]|nr:endolytic transglycosylase MltG [Desulfobacterales bacterium]
YNRLKKGMRLETDPTVIYGIKNFDGNLTRKHLKTPGPYNPYKIKGLPPGPIASPGAAALEAALHPAETRYFYFVSKKDATHYFSTNLKEHNNAVRKFQLSK